MLRRGPGYRLLEAPEVKKAFKALSDPLILVVSGDIYSSVVRHDYDQIGGGAFHRVVTKQIADNRYTGWIQISDAPMQP